MTSPWPATALLLALAVCAASGQNISLGHGSDEIMVPLDKLGIVPGDVIAQLGPHDAPAQAVTAWLHLFPEMTASQRLGVFLHLADWGNQLRSALGPVADKVMESPEQLTRFLTPMEFSRQLARFGTSVRVRGEEWTREDVVDVVSRLPDAALMSWMEKIVNANEDGSLVKSDFESPNPSRPNQDGTLAILGITCAHVSTMDPADVLFFLDRYNAVSKRRVVPFSLVQCFKTKVAEMLRGKEVADPAPETLLDRLSEDEIPQIGFRVLSSFSAANFSRMSRRDLLRQSVALIAAQPMRELIVSMSRQKLVSLTRTFYSVEEDEMEASLDEMGTFVHATGEELMKALPEQLAVLGRKLWEGKDRATLCVPEEVRAKWRIALRSIYGPVNGWTKNTLLTLRDLLINLNPSDWNDLSAEALRSAADTLIAETGYSHVYNGMPSYTNETVFYKVCQHWLGDAEGEKFGKSHFSMMRNLLLASQLNANLEPDTTIVRNTDNGASSPSSQVNGTPDGQRRRRRRSPIGPRPISILEDLNGGSSGDFIGDVDHFRLNKRQAVATEEQTEPVTYMITLIQQYFQAVVRQFNKRIETQTLTPAEVEKVNQANFVYKNASAHFVKQRLNLTEAPFDSFIKVFNEAFENGLIDEDSAKGIRSAIFGFRLTFLRGVAAALDLHPEDFPSGLTADTDQFCRYVRTASFCSNRVPNAKPASTSGENAVALPTAVKCRGMMGAGASVTQAALTKEDVAKWTKEELEQCLSELGKLDLDLDLKRAIWSLMKEKEVTRTSGDHLKVRNLLEAAVYDEDSLDSLAINATHLETLALIGAHSYPADLLEDVSGRIESQTGGDFPTKGSEMMDVLRNVLAFGSMGHLVCGFRDEQLTKLLQKNETAEMLLPIFGQLDSCPNKDALIIMARKAETVYGDASTWSPSLVRSLGLVVSGLTEPARLPVRSFASIDARAIAHAEGHLFEALTEEHLRLFPVEALVYIDTKHFKHLPEKFHYELVTVEEDLPGSGRMLKMMNVYEGNWKEGHEAEMAEIERVRASTEKGAGSALRANLVVMAGLMLTCLVAVGL